MLMLCARSGVMAPKNRCAKGSSIVEGAVGMVILIALLIMITYVILEVSHAYFIWSSLQQGARQAAQLIMSDPNVTSLSTSTADQAIQTDLAQIQIPNVINDVGQFDKPVITYIANPFVGQAGQAQNPTTVGSVQVTVTYLPGQYGLPVFPDADVLNLGKLFKLQATASCNTPN